MSKELLRWEAKYYALLAENAELEAEMNRDSDDMDDNWVASSDYNRLLEENAALKELLQEFCDRVNK